MVTDPTAQPWEYRIQYMDTRGVPRELIKTPTLKATEAVLRIRRTNSIDLLIDIAKRRHGNVNWHPSGWNDMTRRLRPDYRDALRTQPGWVDPWWLAHGVHVR
jgi:hypothetical protein